ncbi:glycosyltransferase [Nakamurella sp. GG22]
MTYHSRQQLEGLLAAARPDQRIAVVDNASGVDGVREVVQRFPHGRWLDGENSGFACAANRGALSSTADFVLFANPDSRPTPEIWDALVGDLIADPTLGSVAAATVNASGRIEIGVGGWEPTPSRVLIYALGLHRLFPHAGTVARPKVGEEVQLGWLTGACLAVRKQTFVELGGFDERYFVYNEDMSFGRSLREAGWGQRLRTELLVPHATGGSGGGSTKMPQQRGASMALYLRDHNGPAATVLMQVMLATGMIPRLVLAAVRGRRTVARQHRAYIKGVLTKRSPYVQ